MKILVKSITLRFSFIALSAALLMAAASCHHNGTSSNDSDTTATPVTALTNKINALHEKTMNKIGPLRALEDSIRGEISIQARKGADTMKLSVLADRLNACDTAMFGWMGQYHTDLSGKADTEKLSYLQVQLQKISRLDKTMDSTMKKAKKQLNASASQTAIP
jgi:hypothetical protein